MAKSGNIGSLERGLLVLELVSERGAVSLAELAHELGASRATMFRLLGTLQRRGYVEHVRSERSYRLGAGVMNLAAGGYESTFIRAAAPFMGELRSLSGETVNLAVYQRGMVTYVAVFEGLHKLRVSSVVGECAQLHSTALGKAVLAGLPEVVAASLVGDGPYERYTHKTRTTWSALRKDLIATTVQGYSVDDGETDLGAVCFGAAIVGRDALPIGALSIEALSARVAHSDVEMYVKELKTRCERLSAQLGAVGRQRR